MVLFIFPGLDINRSTNFQETLPRVVFATTWCSWQSLVAISNHYSLQLATNTRCFATTRCNKWLLIVKNGCEDRYIYNIGLETWENKGKIEFLRGLSKKILNLYAFEADPSSVHKCIGISGKNDNFLSLFLLLGPRASGEIIVSGYSSEVGFYKLGNMLNYIYYYCK